MSNPQWLAWVMGQVTVRVFVFLLSGLFCCLGFSGVIFFAVWAGACFFFAVWAGSQALPKQQKKTRPRPNSKKNTPRPFRACFFFLLFGRVGVFIFLLFGRGACSFFCCWGGGVFFFAVWAGECSSFSVWAGGVFFFAVWAGDGSSLTYPSAWLVFKRPNNKRDRTAKKSTRVPAGYPRTSARTTSS